MKYLSLFSGIEAASVAWQPLGWEPVAFSEIDPFPCAVLAHHYPDVPKLVDICDIDWSEFLDTYGRPDIIVGGSPCQSFSVAGKREGRDGASGLMREYIRAVREVRPRVFLWENVPGALTVERGAAFGQLLAEMDGLGYRLAWRILDSQFFGVPQRRRRVFLVGCLGDIDPASILFESESLRRDFTPSRTKREELAKASGRGAKSRGGECLTMHQNASGDVHVAENNCGTLTASSSVSRQQILVGGRGYVLASGQANAEMADDGTSPTLTCLHEQPILIDRAAYNQGANAMYSPRIERADTADTVVSRGPSAVALQTGHTKGNGGGINTDGVSYTLSLANAPAVALEDGTAWVVRRLTPTECERLQGFPDGYTDIGEWVDDRGHKRKSSDTNRYKALGNSFTVNVVRWIGERIENAA